MSFDLSGWGLTFKNFFAQNGKSDDNCLMEFHTLMSNYFQETFSKTECKEVKIVMEKYLVLLSSWHKDFGLDALKKGFDAEIGGKPQKSLISKKGVAGQKDAEAGNVIPFNAT